MFFLMLNGVFPTWEDTLEGGFWSFKIDKKDIPEIIVLVVYCTNNLKKFNF